MLLIKRFTILAFATTLVAAASNAQSAPRDTTTTLPLIPARTLSFTTDEGTWISLDVSPDGQTIAFDMIGDLYLLSIGGGEARRITSGIAWDAMPTFSPDGREIAFISDRNGTKNVWVVRTDGTGLEMLTKEDGTGLFSPEWSPDGQYIVYRVTPAYGGAAASPPALAMISRKIKRSF